MYDKLGEMLNEALESGKIPQENKIEMESEAPAPEQSQREGSSDSIYFKDSSVTSTPLSNRNSRRNTLKSEKKKQNPTGEVIKMHKYTYNMQHPSEIQKALTTLDIAYPFSIKDIPSKYHKKLKEIHPDTKNTIQTSDTVQNIRQMSIDDIRNSYKILCDFFGMK